jgi:hypothetical protein
MVTMPIKTGETMWAECPNCGETKWLVQPHEDCERMCSPCTDAAETYGRQHMSEAWCSHLGCWNPPTEDFCECEAHAK